MFNKIRYLMISEYDKYHISPLIQELSSRLQEEFLFVETGTYTNDLLITNNITSSQTIYNKLSLKAFPQYNREVEDLVINVPVLILGFGQETYYYNQLRLTNNPNALTYKIKERLFRWGYDKISNPAYHNNLDYKYTNWFNCSKYILCSSAYTAYDFTLLGAPHNKLLSFGYWNTPSIYSKEELFKLKKSSSYVNILWVGRFISLKKPELVLNIISKLKNYNIHLTMVGYGELLPQIKLWISQYGLLDKVTILGPLNVRQVRNIMSASHILIMTSDYQEGWGMVIQEAMTEGCVVFSSACAGASAFLINHMHNGFIFDLYDTKTLINNLRNVISNTDLLYTIGENAYDFMNNTWTINSACKRLIEASDTYINTNTFPLYSSGYLSPSPLLKNANDAINYSIKKI